MEYLYKLIIGGFIIGHGSKETMDREALEIPGAKVIKTGMINYDYYTGSEEDTANSNEQSS